MGKSKSKKNVESSVMGVSESGAMNPGSKVDEVSKSKKEKKRKHKLADEDNVSEGATEKVEESSKRKKKRKAADENDLAEDSSTKQDSCDGEPKEKKRKKMAVEPEHVEEAVSKSTAAEEVIANG